jgi:hypothetical protein
VTIYEGGSKVLTGYMLARHSLRGKVEVTGQDTYVRVVETHLDEDEVTTSGSSVGNYIDYIMGMTGVSYQYDEFASTQGVEEGVQIGPGSAHNALLAITRFSGLFTWVDADGVVHFNTISGPTAHNLSASFMEHEEIDDDELTRHTIKVWGFGNIFGSSSGSMLGDPVERIGVIECPYLTADYDAESVALYALSLYNKHGDIRTIKYAGAYPQYKVPDIVTAPLDSEILPITSVLTELTQSGQTTTVVLNERSPYLRGRPSVTPAGHCSILTFRAADTPFTDRIYTCTDLTTGSWFRNDDGLTSGQVSALDLMVTNPADRLEVAAGDFYDDIIYNRADITTGSWAQVFTSGSLAPSVPCSTADLQLHDIRFDTSGSLYSLWGRGDFVNTYKDNSELIIVKSTGDFSGWGIFARFWPFLTSSGSDPQLFNEHVGDHMIMHPSGIYVIASDSLSHAVGGSSWRMEHYAKTWRVDKTSGSAHSQLGLRTAVVYTVGYNAWAETSFTSVPRNDDNSSGSIQFVNHYSYSQQYPTIGQYYQWKATDSWAGFVENPANNPSYEWEPTTWPEDTGATGLYCDYESGARTALFENEQTSGSTHYYHTAAWNVRDGIDDWVTFDSVDRVLYFSGGQYGIRWTSDWGDGFSYGPEFGDSNSRAARSIVFHEDIDLQETNRYPYPT